MGMKSKKGAVFSILAILMVAAILAYSTTSYISLTDQTQRITSANAFVKNTVEDAELALYASGFRSIIALLEEIRNSGEYIPNVEASFETLMVNGTYNNASSFLLENNTLTSWVTRINTQANLIGLDVSTSLANVSLEHPDPWTITVSADFYFLITDTKGVASWEFTKEITENIPIEGFDDPLYIIGTANTLNHVIIETPYEDAFVTGSDTTNITDHIEQGYYIAWDGAPSFLDRLEGNTGPNEQGIESLVDKEALGETIAIVVEKSSADHEYFGSGATPIYSYTNMPTNFRLDNQSNHSAIYQLGALAN
jgi:hypothetical protein